MDSIQDVSYAIIMRMTNNKIMSINRLVKLVYLVDWSATLNHSNKIGGLNWRNGLCGPNDTHILGAIQQCRTIFEVRNRPNCAGIQEVVILNYEYHPVLSEKVLCAIQHIAKVAMRLPWDKLSLLVSSTYPMLVSQVGDSLDLIKFSTEYKSISSSASIGQKDTGKNDCLP